MSWAYNSIFGKGRARDKVDCIITGVGAVASGNVSAKKRFGLYTKECLKMWGIDSKWLSEHAIGDIGGVYIERPGLSDENKRSFEKKTSLWLGAKLEDLQRCARKGQEGKPGVLVAAVGDRNLAEVIFACCTRLGIITELFIDHEMEKHLTAICDERERESR